MTDGSKSGSPVFPIVTCLLSVLSLSLSIASVAGCRFMKIESEYYGIEIEYVFGAYSELYNGKCRTFQEHGKGSTADDAAGAFVTLAPILGGFVMMATFVRLCKQFSIRVLRCFAATSILSSICQGLSFLAMKDPCDQYTCKLEAEGICCAFATAIYMINGIAMCATPKNAGTIKK